MTMATTALIQQPTTRSQNKQQSSQSSHDDNHTDSLISSINDHINHITARSASSSATSSDSESDHELNNNNLNNDSLKQQTNENANCLKRKLSHCNDLNDDDDQDEDEDKVIEINDIKHDDEDDHDNNHSKAHHSSLRPKLNDKKHYHSSTEEEEEILVENSSDNNKHFDAKIISNDSNQSINNNDTNSDSKSIINSLSSLIKMETITTKQQKQHSSSLLKTKKISTGKLERITERLAKKHHSNIGQNNHNNNDCNYNISNDDQSVKTLKNTTNDGDNNNSKHSKRSSCTNDSNDTEFNEMMDVDNNGAIQIMNRKSSTSSSIDDNEELLLRAENDDLDDIDEDEEELENGFQTLGLMGNAAYMNNDDAFRCPVCGIKLDSQHTFTLHIRSHNPNDHSNTCSLCGKTLSSASSLDRHMLIHSGERPFKCSLCGMAFTTNGNMHRHMRTHGHGSIGYTPRGQKRRAKLLTQALEKAVAAAAAGEEVDYEAINKLKKSILESKVTVPVTTNGKRQSKNQQQQSAATTFSEQLLSSLAPNVSIEEAAAAAVAAAHNVSGSDSDESIISHLSAVAAATANQQHQNGNSRKHRNRNSQIAITSHFNNTNAANSTKSSDKLKEHLAKSPAPIHSPLNLTNGNNNSWPLNQSQTTNTTPPTTIPEKGRPGRKKKQRLSAEMTNNFNQQTNQVQIPQAAPLAAPCSPSSTTTNIMSPLQTSTTALSPLSRPTPPSSATPFVQPKDRCPICAHPVCSMPELHLHMIKYHCQEQLFCNDCGMILDNYDTYTRHHCTASAATVMTALSQNPNLQSDLLFCSSNTSRMNFSSARAYAANLDLLRGLQVAAAAATTTANQNNHKASNNHNHTNNLQAAAAAQVMLQAAQLAQQQQQQLLSPSAQNINRKSSSSSSNSQINCSQCNRKFSSNKELKHHHEIYCHHCHFECDSISTYQLHQFSHSFEKLTNQQQQQFTSANITDKMQLFQNAATPPASFPLFHPQLTATNPMISSSLLSSQQNLKQSSPPSQPQQHKSISQPNSTAATSSSIASLTSMANMKPDLADIESILSIVHATNAMKNSTNNNHQSLQQQLLRSTISPNRASDAGSSLQTIKRRPQMNGGEATNQPDSPASADSAAGAIAASSSAAAATNISASKTNNQSIDQQQKHRQSATKTDLNNQSKSLSSPSALCLIKSLDKNDEKNKIDHSESKESVITSKKNESNKNNHSFKTLAAQQRFRCETCRLSFKSLNALRRHNRGHTAEGGHTHGCHLCPYKSLDKSTLIRHLRTHNGERPFQCAICKYAFTTKANCERHIRKRHRNLKTKYEIGNAMQFNIDMASTAAATRLVSEKIFVEKDQLPTSQDTICKKCGQDFGTNRELRQHLRQSNNPCSQQLKPFICTICNVGFNTRNNCVRHIIKQHPCEIGNTNFNVNITENCATNDISYDDDLNEESIKLIIETSSTSSNNSSRSSLKKANGDTNEIDKNINIHNKQQPPSPLNLSKKSSSEDDDDEQLSPIPIEEDDDDFDDDSGDYIDDYVDCIEDDEEDDDDDDEGVPIEDDDEDFECIDEDDDDDRALPVENNDQDYSGKNNIDNQIIHKQSATTVLDLSLKMNK